MKNKNQKAMNLSDYIVAPQDGISVYVNNGGTITIEGDDGGSVVTLISFHPHHASEICRAIRHAAKLASGVAACKSLSSQCTGENQNN